MTLSSFRNKFIWCHTHNWMPIRYEKKYDFQIGCWTLKTTSRCVECREEN